MAQPNIIQDGMDRVQGAVKSIDKRYRKLQKQAEKRRRSFERTAERRVKRVQAELRKNPFVKRAESLRGDTVQLIEERVEQLLATFRIATQGEVERLDRKVNTLARKLRELERDLEPA